MKLKISAFQLPTAMIDHSYESSYSTAPFLVVKKGKNNSISMTKLQFSPGEARFMTNYEL
jgi:hypothetical protein